MSCYWVYGTLGAGKGIFFAKKMQDYLRRGSRVATNVQVFPERLSPNFNTPITRLPDIPRLEDIIALGRGAPYGEKKKLGGLFLDETSIFLNSRDWNDKDRPKWIAYLRLIRKKGWDIYLATQDPESVDKQILKGLGEEFICCTRKDHFRLGIFSDLYDIYNIIKSKGTETESKILPHINSAGYRRGKKTQGNKNYRSEMYRPTQYFGTYDTNQLFQIKYEHLNGRDVDMRAPYTLLPGVTLRKYQLIRDKYYPDVVLPDYENTEEDEELEPEMKIQLDEIKLPKESHLSQNFSYFSFCCSSA
ncbi:zonular occludens toxin domain-containing protein [Vibrio taketomensis]|uniref:zonular occludens toxin domain-containing protein n=1 Tax=Vibrio taketomensis TaxID=2572923 RepID=UPI001389D642|nr:zonular occludens toxin domain-containing protein [Vibrio taketomensis]